MCLLISLKKEHKNNGSHAEEIYKEYLSIAEDDITVYKVLNKNERGNYYSPYQKALYEEGKSYKQEFTFAEHATSHIGYTRVYQLLAVHKGLHSYETIDAACKDIVADIDGKDVVCEFVIPKGSLVFKEGNEICSNAYTFKGVLTHAS